jgi:hypothetical protein
VSTGNISGSTPKKGKPVIPVSISQIIRALIIPETVFQGAGALIILVGFSLISLRNSAFSR